jgi:ubiquinone biosynthesis protein
LPLLRARAACEGTARPPPGRGIGPSAHWHASCDEGCRLRAQRAVARIFNAICTAALRFAGVVLPYRQEKIMSPVPASVPTTQRSSTKARAHDDAGGGRTADADAAARTTAPGARAAQLLRFATRYRHLFGDSEAEVRAEDAQAFVDDVLALGPAFIKIGQSLSIRPDLLPPAYIKALAQLQDNTTTIPFDLIRQQIEGELGVRLSHAFPQFDEEPLAAASLAQVHTARLRDGRAVVVKVQRPGIEQEIRADLEVLGTLAKAADRLTEQGRRAHFEQWIEEMTETLAEETDYRLEADNLRIFRENLSGYPTLFIPAPVADFSARRVLTMDRVVGTKVDTAIGLRRTEAPLAELADDLMRAYLDQIFIHGLVHADPHPGNVILMEEGLGLVDLGMVARLGPRMRHGLMKLLAAIVEGDGDRVAVQGAALSERLEIFDEAVWSRRCGRMITRFHTRGERTGPGEGGLMIDLMRLSLDCGLRPPPEMALLGRTLLALENIARTLAPNASPRTVVREHMNKVVVARLSDEISMANVKLQVAEMAELGRDLPRQARVLLDTLAGNRLRVRISGLEESRLLENLQKIANRISAGIICAALVIGAALVLRIDVGPKLFGYPGIALVMFVLAFVLSAVVLGSALLSDRSVSRYRTRQR